MSHIPNGAVFVHDIKVANYRALDSTKCFASSFCFKAPEPYVHLFMRLSVNLQDPYVSKMGVARVLLQ